MSDYLFSDRGDGLGERLNSVMNGLFVSLLTGLPYKFIWPDMANGGSDFNSIAPAHEVFSEEFLRKHFVSQNDELRSSRDVVFGRGDLSHIVKDLKEQVSQGARRVNQKGFIFNVGPPTDRIRLWESVNNTMTFRAEIVDLMNCVRDESQKQVEHVVVHVRAGDIIYGKHRETPQFLSKIIPLPLVVVAARALSKRGIQVKILGQESASVRRISSSEGFLDPVSVGDIAPMSSLHASFVDLAQFGSARRIYAGSSGFPRFASQYFLVPIKNLLAEIDVEGVWEEVFKEIEDHSEFYPAEQKACAYFYGYLNLQSVDFDFSNFLLSSAVIHQPKNIMYAFWVVLNNLKFRKYESADEKFIELFSEWRGASFKQFSRGALYRLLTRVNPRTRLPYWSIFSDFIRVAEESGAYSARFLATFLDPEFSFDEVEWGRMQIH